MHLCLK